MPELYVVGTGGFAREIHQWARDAGLFEDRTFGGFVGPGEVTGHASLPDEALRLGDEDRLLLGIGRPDLRRRLTDSLAQRGARFSCLIHPTALVSPEATLGEGVIICPFATVTSGAELGDYALLNLYALVGHDARVGPHAILSPRATIGGEASLDEEVFLGAHAVVAPGRCIGARSRIGAGTAVLRDLAPGSLLLDAPPRPRRIYSQA